MHVLSEMEVEAKTDVVLEALEKNRENHVVELAESREAFFKLAKQRLKEALADVREGKEENTHVYLDYPTGHVEAYDTAISMLKLHQEKTVVLNSTQVRCLVDDDWDWQGNFKLQNSTYIGSVR